MLQKKRKLLYHNTSYVWVLLTTSLFLVVAGLYFIFEASSVLAFRTYGDPFYFVKLQCIWVGLGIFAMILFSFFNYHNLYYVSFPSLLITIILLIIVLIPGIGESVSGARRWIQFGAVNIQPSELAKLSVLLYLCSWFLHKERKRFFSFLLLLLFVISLVMFQPDMGTAIILLSIFVITYFLADYEKRYLFFLIPFLLFLGTLAIVQSPYRFQRLMAFYNPKEDPLGATYHLNQALVSFYRGGFFGVGLGASRQKYQYLPEAHTDSIFAIIGEETGFAGSFIMVTTLFIFATCCFLIGLKSRDRFGRLLAGGICAVFSVQTIINIGSMIHLFPMTGVPLPFVSYGGSSLVVFFSFVGILFSIARYSKI